MLETIIQYIAAILLGLLVAGGAVLGFVVMVQVINNVSRNMSTTNSQTSKTIGEVFKNKD